MAPPRAHRPGFTLIELLVVIAIVALLIGLLLPALGKAREAGRTAKCLVNMKSFAYATVSYAQDYKDRVWPARPRTSYPNGNENWPADPNPDPADRNVYLWAQQVVNGVRQPGLLYEYLATQHAVGECPTNKRRTVSGTERTNVWNSRTGVQFDYTMFDESEGARLGGEYRIAWLAPARNNNARVLSPLEAPNLTNMRSLPVFVEESTKYFNESFRDGGFGNEDQLTTRHANGGHIAYLDGSAELFKAPTDGNELVANRAVDFECNDLFVNRRSTNTWHSISDITWRFSWQQGYGWINDPK